MADPVLPRRAHYMLGVMDALHALGGSAGPAEVSDWLLRNGMARTEDVETQLPSGGNRFEKEVRFARLMLARAGLVDRPDSGQWVLTDAGRTRRLTPPLADTLLKALIGVRAGALSAERTYRAIIEAARQGRFVSYGDLARASGVPWIKARRPLPLLLDRLTFLFHVRHWPMLSSIVVNMEDQETGEMAGAGLKGFIAAARRIGIDPGDDPAAFAREQQQRVFEWAPTAPERMEVAGRKDAPLDEEEEEAFALTDPAGGGLQEAGAPMTGSGEARERRYWFGGAAWTEGDQTARFIEEGVWRNGYHDQFSDLVREMAPGDRIAIKSAFVQKLGLPFDAGGAKVSVMRIKATGTVIGNPGDGLTVQVAWDPAAPPRDWYLYTYMKTLHRADPAVEQARRLIEFAFGGQPQDYDWWLSQPYFAAKYGRKALPDATDESEADADPDLAPLYTTQDIVAQGCFLDLDVVDDIIARLRARKNLILQGPPGTGKTWLARKLAHVLLGTQDRATTELRTQVVQFHPSLAYEDFVRGWRPMEGQLRLADGVFLRAIEAALSEPDRPFVLVIEEINRGNPAQVLGEMLTLLEDSKRRPEEALELAYPRPGERVYIPENLYVIGTMNVADRSLALVDLALRRRFAFVSLEPALGEAWRRWARREGGLSEAVVARIETRLGALNDTIARDRALGPQFRIGHSYVTPNRLVGEDGGEAWYRSVVETEIVPLLDEYWYDQPDKVAEARAALLSDMP